jgi:hypothetical protein
VQRAPCPHRLPCTGWSPSPWPACAHRLADRHASPPLPRPQSGVTPCGPHRR